MKIRKTGIAIMISLLLSAIGQSCVSVPAYQRMYLEDPDMKLSSREVEHFEQEMHTYREGVSGANGGKSGGGCGCN